MASHRTQANPSEDAVEQLRRRLGPLDPQQVAIWRAISPARRLALAFQAYQFALDIVRLTVRRAHPELSPEELKWRITRRMQGDRSLGREQTSACQQRGEEE
jgi:hypothetical protein